MMKSAVYSKTIWFSLLVMALQFLENNASWFQSLVPDSYGELAGYGIGIIIAILRLVTSKGIGKEKPKPRTAPKLNDRDLKGF